MRYNPEIHHRKSTRLKGHDYSAQGRYFITINVKDRIRQFGHVEAGKMFLSEVGKIANECLSQIPDHFRHAAPGEFIVMPDHIHLILILINDESKGPPHGAARTNEININEFGNPIPGSVSVIINQYKSSVKRWCNKNDHEDFQWQSRFHMRIIQSDLAFERISNYIIKNPASWRTDTL